MDLRVLNVETTPHGYLPPACMFSEVSTMSMLMYIIVYLYIYNILNIYIYCRYNMIQYDYNMYSAVCIFATCKSPATITEHLWVSGAVLAAADTQRFTVTNVLQYRVEFKSCWDTMLIKVPNSWALLGNQNMSSENSPRLDKIGLMDIPI